MLNPSPLLGMAFIPIEIEIIIFKKSCQFILTNPVVDNLFMIVGQATNPPKNEFIKKGEVEIKIT